MMNQIVYINGKLVPMAEAVVGIEDRGFQFGDGVYEVIRVYDGKPFALQRHLARLQASATAIKVPVPLAVDDLAAACVDVFHRSGLLEGTIYIQLTRGAAPRAHHFPGDIQPTLVIYGRKLEQPSAAIYEQGCSVIVIPDERWGHCHIKSTNLLANVLAKEKARQAGAYESILEREGYGITEGSSSNVFAVTGGVVVTPPRNQNILGGITRDLVLDVARLQGFAVEERILSHAELMEAEEVFLSGTTVEVMPVTRVDENPVASGVVGETARSLLAGFRTLIREGVA